MNRLTNGLLSLLILSTGIANTTAAKTNDPVPAKLHWIGNTPTEAKPVRFGIPFNKGEMRPNSAFTLTTEQGQELQADFWPTAYWPDGSVKWGGFASVIPGGTESVTFTPNSKTQKLKNSSHSH